MFKNINRQAALIGGCFLIFAFFLFLPGLFNQQKVGADESSLVGYWDFDTPTDFQENDHSGHNNHGYLTNGLWGMKGVSGYCIQYDGDDFLDMGDQSDFDFDQNDSFSLSVWVKLSDQVGNYRAIMGKANSDSQNGYVLRTQTNGGLSMMIEAANGSQEANAKTTLDYRDDQWHFVVGVVDRANQKVILYVDGNKRGEVDARQVGSLENNYHFNLASLNRTAVRFSGLLDEAKVYQRALSAQEIEDAYQQDCQQTGVCLSNDYGPGSLLRSRETNKVYYINQKLQKKWILNSYVFELYGNDWKDVTTVSEAELNIFKTVNLIRAINGEKVYYISGQTREWIQFPLEFEARGFDWQDIDDVKIEEILEYEKI